MKIVINKCYGGFCLSQEALNWLYEKGQEQVIENSDDKCYDGYDVPRNDPLLIECIETLGASVCSGDFSKLTLVEIPDGVNWEISECNGVETAREVSRVFG